MKFEQVENKIEQYFANVSDQEILNLFIKAGYKFEKKMKNIKPIKKISYSQLVDMEDSVEIAAISDVNLNEFDIMVVDENGKEMEEKTLELTKLLLAMQTVKKYKKNLGLK